MEEQLTIGQVAKKWGLIYGLISAVVNLIPLLIEQQASWMLVVNIIIAVAIYVMATKEYKADNGGFMTFGEGFKISMFAALIAGVIRPLINYVYIKFIDPTVTERMAQAAIDSMMQQGMSEQEIEQMSSFTSGISNPELGLVLGFVWIVLGALIWGSIVSAVNKNEAEEF